MNVLRNTLIILFLVIWFSNTQLCYLLYPQASEIYKQYIQAITAKHILYEVMLLLLLMLAFMTPTRLTRAFITSGVVLVFSSILDKTFQGVLSYSVVDIIVIVFSIFIGFYVYKNSYIFEKL